MGAVFCVWSRWLSGVRLVPRWAARADRSWIVGTIFLSVVAAGHLLLCVWVLLEEYRVWVSCSEDVSTETCGRISHRIYVLGQLALLGSTLDTWCIFSWLLEEFRTFSTLRWTCSLRFRSLLFSSFAEWRSVNSRCFCLQFLANAQFCTRKPGHHSYELTYLAKQKTDGF